MAAADWKDPDVVRLEKALEMLEDFKVDGLTRGPRTTKALQELKKS